MAVQLTDEKLEEIQFELEGTCKALEEIIEAHELDISADALEDRLLDPPHPIERSKCCEWWFEVSNLEFDEDRNGGVCADCNPDLHLS